MMRFATSFALCFLGLAQAASAEDTRFFSQQILAFGSAQVDARAINDAGAIAGISYSGPGLPSIGFVLQGSVETFIGCESSACYPTAISHDGTVAGFSGTGGFVSRNNTLLASGLPLGQFGGSPSTLPNVVLSSSGLVAFTDATLTGSTVFGGVPGKTVAQKGLASAYARVNGINAHGVLSGVEFATIDGEQVAAIFTGKRGFFVIVNTPECQQVTGGIINDAGQVAYASQSSAYVYANGNTTTIALPAGASQPSVQAINNRGRVVGTYVDSSQTQHIFFYNGTSVTSYGAYTMQEVLHLALNNHGAMLVSDMSHMTGLATSYLVRCSGGGC